MLDCFYQLEPYGLDKGKKIELLTDELKDITQWHYEHCDAYRNILDAMNYRPEEVKSYYQLPFIPVRMFKQMDLMSIDKKEIFKTMTSSGTTGQAVSKIYVDKETALNQQKVLVNIMGDFIGKQRLSMLIVDSPKVVKERDLF